jgi:ABC-2 type transport system permease protein
MGGGGVSEWHREVRGALAVFRRNFVLVRRYLGWEVVALFYNVVNTLTIALIASLTPPAEQSRVIVYLVIGALVWNFLSVLFSEIANSVTWERWEGTIEASFMAPIRRVTYLLGMSAYAVTYALMRSAVVLAVVVLAFHVRLPQADWGGAVAVFLAAGLPFTGIGLMTAVLPLLSAEKGAQTTQILQGVLLLVSGVYYPVSVLPTPLRILGELSPATYCLEAARAAVLGGEGILRLLPTVGGLLLAGVVLVPAGFLVFAWGERVALRTGRLKRNG